MKIITPSLSMLKPLLVTSMLFLLTVLIGYLVKDAAWAGAKSNKMYPYSKPGVPLSLEQHQMWISDRFTTLTQQEAALVDSYLVQVHHSQNDSEFQKIQNIVSFLNQELDPKQGDAECCDFMDPVKLMSQSFSQNKSVYCTHYATIYTLFANRVGVPTRMVHIRVLQDSDVAMHVVAESYISSIGKWVMVDPTYGQSYMSEDSNGSRRFLNTQEVITLFSNSPDSNLVKSPNKTVHISMRNKVVDVTQLTDEEREQISQQSLFFSHKENTVLLYENADSTTTEFMFNPKLKNKPYVPASN